MNNNKKRPRLLAESKGAKTEKSSCKLFIDTSNLSVNRLVLFRFAAVNGLALAGGWAERLAIWCPLVDMAALMLRASEGGRR